MIDFNGRWLGALSSSDWIRLCSRYTVARMLERDDFTNRMQANQPIAIHELLYPLAQAFDSVALKADFSWGVPIRSSIFWWAAILCESTVSSLK